jgi:hypothetical protein
MKLTSPQVVSAPCILAPFLLYFLPESVRWQVAKGRINQAKAIMSKCNMVKVRIN